MMSSSRHENELKNTGEEKRDINILLIGEAGVGKKTFINSFANYLQYDTLDDARKGKLYTVIATKFNFGQIVVVADESSEIDISTGPVIKSYAFPIRGSDRRIRFINTPGISYRSLSIRNAEFEHILSEVEKLNHLNAVCILLQPFNANDFFMFESYFKYLLWRLEKHARNNLIFLFCKSKKSNYCAPEHTIQLLEKLLNEVRIENIPLSRENVFCTDNEAFEYLATIDYKKFSDDEVCQFSVSWKRSIHECWRMISYIAGNATRAPLIPFQIKTNSFNNFPFPLTQPSEIQSNACKVQQQKSAVQMGDKIEEEVEDNHRQAKSGLDTKNSEKIKYSKIIMKTNFKELREMQVDCKKLKSDEVKEKLEERTTELVLLKEEVRLMRQDNNNLEQKIKKLERKLNNIQCNNEKC